MTITIKLKTDNAAFEDDKHGEVERILTAMLDDWRAIQSEGTGNLYDSNGNKVGTVTITGN